MHTKDWFALAGFLLLPQLAGLIGSFFTMSAISSWYTTLVRPDIAPPNWVFGPVWTALFVLMGVGAFLVWKHGRGAKRRLALQIFCGQLVLNTGWSIFFFGLQNPTLALFEIVFLWIAIAATIWSFYKISRTAAYLLVPYLLWVSFASYLNWQFVLLN